MLAEYTTRIATAIAKTDSFKHTLKFDFGDEGKIFIDGNAQTASNADSAADCTVSVKLDDFTQMVAGTLDPQMAFFSGKLKVAGDMGIAMKLQPIMAAARG